MKTARLYSCSRCHAQVIICPSCDRGNRYCTEGCSLLARQESHRFNNRKYQKTRKGRFKNAARQAAYRLRQKQKVTDQGSTQKARHASLRATLDKAGIAQNRRPIGSGLRCHHCGELCNPFLRLDFLQQTRCSRPFRRGWYPV